MTKALTDEEKAAAKQAKADKKAADKIAAAEAKAKADDGDAPDAAPAEEKAAGKKRIAPETRVYHDPNSVPAVLAKRAAKAERLKNAYGKPRGSSSLPKPKKADKDEE